MACEGLGTHEGVHDPVDVSCKHPWCQGLLQGARCGAVTHGAVRVPAGAGGCGIGWGGAEHCVLLEPCQGFQAESNLSICCAYFLLTCVIKSKLPGTKQKKQKNEGAWRLQPSCLQGEAVKWHLREELGLSHCGAACAHSDFQCLQICARGSWPLHFCQLPPQRQNLTSCFSFPLICLLPPPLFPCPHDSHKKIMETIWE